MKAKSTTLRTVLGAFLAVCCALRPAGSDSRIAFSAEYFRWGHHQLVSEQRNHHLYLIAPDGTRLSPVTSGDHDDSFPVWSPDRRRILFLRRAGDGSVRVCMIALPGKRVASLYDFGDVDHAKCAWSPNGIMVAATAATYSSAGGHDPFIMLNRGAVVTKVAGVRDFAWSPDSRHVFLRYNTGACAIADATTGAIRPLHHSIRYPVWLNDQSVLGLAAKTRNGGDNALMIIDCHQDRALPLKVAFKQPHEITPFGPYVENVSWFRSPRDKMLFMAQADRTMSDGRHSRCYLVNLRSAKSTWIGPYEFCGWSAKGDYYAVTNHQWFGVYKRGGQRLGPLEIRPVSAGAAKTISPKLVDIEGASWFCCDPAGMADCVRAAPLPP